MVPNERNRKYFTQKPHMLAPLSTFKKTVGGIMFSESAQDYITLKLSVSREPNSPLRCVIHVSSSHGKIVEIQID